MDKRHCDDHGGAGFKSDCVECAKGSTSASNDLLSRIKALEARVAYLENKPAEYVPPPTYGLLPKHPHPPPIILSEEQNDKIREAIAKLNKAD